MNYSLFSVGYGDVSRKWNRNIRNVGVSRTVGQTHYEVHFYGRRSGCGFYFTPEEAMFVFQGPFRSNENESKPPIYTNPPSQVVSLALNFIESNPKGQAGGKKGRNRKNPFLNGK